MRYIGCKNNLLENIKSVIDEQAPDVQTFCDIFSGTATVARYIKQFFEVYSNDLLYFSYVLQRATIENDSIPTFHTLSEATGIDNPILYLNDMPTTEMEALSKDKRFFQNNYAPAGGRMYLQDDNALRIDYARNIVNDWNDEGLLSPDEFFYLVACIVEGVPFVSNISGTYGAYHKTWDKRTFNEYQLFPLEVTTNGKDNKSYNMNCDDLLATISGDVLYADPPYNNRQYLPNYHVLETAAKYDNPDIHGVTGQRDYADQKSDFCLKGKAAAAFERLVSLAQFQHILISYSTEGMVPIETIEEIMKSYGNPETFHLYRFPYRRFKSNSRKPQKEELSELIFYIEK